MARTKPPLPQGVPIPSGDDEHDSGSHVATPPQEQHDFEVVDPAQEDTAKDYGANHNAAAVTEEEEGQEGEEHDDNEVAPQANGGPRRESEDGPSTGEKVVQEIVAEVESEAPGPVGLGIANHEEKQTTDETKHDAVEEGAPAPTITMTEAPEEGEHHDAPPEHPSPQPGEEEMPPRPQAPTPLHASETVRRTLPSITLITSALETIANSKEARKRQQLAESAKKALEAIKATEPDAPDPEIIFEPLNLACQVHNANLTVTSLDSIDKLISYGYFTSDVHHPPPAPASEDAEGSEDGDRESQPKVPPPVQQQKPPLIERAIETVSGCFIGESTDDKVQMQIIKALLSAVLNDKFVVHGAGLLKAVRQTYNIFLLSRSSQNQTVAQGALTQMVHMVFERVKSRIQAKEARLNLSGINNNYSTSTTTINAPHSATDHEGDGDAEGETPQLGEHTSETPPPPQEKITLQSFENRKSFDDERITDNAPTVVTVDVPRASSSRPTTAGSGTGSAHTVQNDRASISSEQDAEDEVFIKDAFLVFRAMCKLSIKLLPIDQTSDLKSHGMRSKLLSLHLIHTILKNHAVVFTNPLVTIRGSSNTDAPTEFVQATKQYLCLSLSRNAASPVPWVFAVCSEIFWLVVRDMRGALKKEMEVFMKEIYIAILDNKNSSVQQKQSILMLFQKICNEPKALVEIYLNYDCDRNALDNMFQRIVEHLSKISASPVHLTNIQQHNYDEVHPTKSASAAYSTFALPPSLSTSAVASAPLPGQETAGLYPVEYLLKRHSLENLVDALRALVTWSQRGMESTYHHDISRESLADRDSLDDSRSKSISQSMTPNLPSTPQHELDRKPGSPDIGAAADDPSQFEKVKLRKSALSEAIRKFNFKPKRGIKALIDQGFIKDNSPESIAEFLLTNESLDKAMIGEYLGEADTENVQTMHAFVDQMDFVKMRFVDALRRFLQGFRLPGEAQKIDRFMLKFAERYISGNPNSFANADTAYVLAYSVIMLNTDQHSAQVKNRMTKEDFIKNNRGINDGQDLPEEYLTSIFEEIRDNEIILDTEKAAIQSLAAQQQGVGIAAGIGQALATVGRDLQREAYVQASEEMANKTEQLFKTLLRAQKKSSTKMPATSKFVSASSFRHVGPMFEVVWMSFLSGLSEPSQESSDLDTIRLCMEGFRLAIKIACRFDQEIPREAFVGALTRFTQLSNLSEMKPKNVEALKVLLDVAQTEGNSLKKSWTHVLTSVSRLERFQLLSQGVDEGMLPDVGRNRLQPDDHRRSSIQSTRSNRTNRSRHTSTFYQQDVAEESRSREVVIAIDKIFANTAQLNGDAIVFFVKALCEVSLEEVQSSGQSESPRMFSLQKLVEISYYNMNRIRFEWSNLWAIIGEHFNQVGCLSNTSVVFFALDSLRQLSMRFLEIEELPHFKFQKDFLKPFEHVMANSSHAKVKDMVLQCLNQMLQARGDNIKSGWRTMFGTYSFAAREQYDNIVDFSFKTVQKIFHERFGIIVNQGSFADLIVCLTEFAKNLRFQIVSLQAIELLKGTVPQMLNCPECPLCPKSIDYPGKDRKEEDLMGGAKIRTTKEDPHIKYWFPVLFSFHDILMTGEDLEVRSRALQYLFDTLIRYGKDYPPAFWDTVCRQLLFPIFMVLKSRSEVSRFNNHEDMTVWLSTTMIQALRNLIQLFTHFFDVLERFLDGFLELLITCICQENDTIARIGSSCLQQLILQNVRKWQDEHWKKIVNAFVQLFETTTAYQLFSATTPGPVSSNGPSSPTKVGFADDGEDGVGPAPSSENSLKINGLEHKISQLSEGIAPTEHPDDGEEEPEHSRTQLEEFKPSGHPQAAPVVTAARRKYFNKIITKCVLQLLMIETVSELFSNDAVYSEIPSAELLRLMSLLKKSFTFARKFNNDKELRMRLFREGFMKQPPNLLKQESGSAATYVSILFRMHRDEDTERKKSRADVEDALIPLCVDIISGYVELDAETQQRNIVAWRPVVVEVLEGYNGFGAADFARYIETFYLVVTDLLNREMGVEVRMALQTFLRRVGEVRLGITAPAGSMGRRRGASVISRRA